MGTYDYSAYFAPVQQDGQGRGMSIIADTLDAIMQRRHQQQLKAAENKAAMERALMQEAGDMERAQMTDQRERAQHADSSARDWMRVGADLQGRKAPHLLEGNLSLAEPYQRMIDSMPQLKLGDPASTALAQRPAPAAQPEPQAPAPPTTGRPAVEPPPFAPAQDPGDAPMPMFGEQAPVPSPAPAAPAAAQPAPVDPADAIVQGRAADAKRKQEEARAALGPLVKEGDKFGADALEYVLHGIGANSIKREDWANAFIDRKQFLENQAGSDRRAREGRIVITPGEGRRLNATERGELRSDIKDWQQDNGYDDMAKAHRELRGALNDIKSGNPVAQSGARFAIGRKIAGAGVFTEGEQKAILGRVGGEFERWSQLVQTYIDGKLTPEQEKVFADYIESKLGHLMNDEARRMASNFRDSFMGDGSAYGNRMDEVRNRYNRLFTPFGITALDVQTGDERMIGKSDEAWLDGAEKKLQKGKGR